MIEPPNQTRANGTSWLGMPTDAFPSWLVWLDGCFGWETAARVLSLFGWELIWAFCQRKRMHIPSPPRANALSSHLSYLPPPDFTPFAASGDQCVDSGGQPGRGIAQRLHKASEGAGERRERRCLFLFLFFPRFWFLLFSYNFSFIIILQNGLGP